MVAHQVVGARCSAPLPVQPRSLKETSVSRARGGGTGTSTRAAYGNGMGLNDDRLSDSARAGLIVAAARRSQVTHKRAGPAVGPDDGCRLPRHTKRGAPCALPSVDSIHPQPSLAVFVIARESGGTGYPVASPSVRRTGPRKGVSAPIRSRGDLQCRWVIVRGRSGRLPKPMASCWYRVPGCRG